MTEKIPHSKSPDHAWDGCCESMSHFEHTKKQGPQSRHWTHCWRSQLHIEHFTDGGKAS